MECKNWPSTIIGAAAIKVGAKSSTKSSRLTYMVATAFFRKSKNSKSARFGGRRWLFARCNCGSRCAPVAYKGCAPPGEGLRPRGGGPRPRACFWFCRCGLGDVGARFFFEWVHVSRDFVIIVYWCVLL